MRLSYYFTNVTSNIFCQGEPSTDISVVVSERKASDLNSTVLEVPSGQFIITFSC